MNEKNNIVYVELEKKQYDGIENIRNWRDIAACKGMDIKTFMPETKSQTREALAICAGCLVIRDCLKYALQNEIKYGIWGGKTERELRTILINHRLLDKTVQN